MKRRIITRIQDWADESLRRQRQMCIRDSDVRVTLIVIMLLLFGGVSVYMTVSSIYRIGREDGQHQEKERAGRLRLRNDSVINPFIGLDHGTVGED